MERLIGVRLCQVCTCRRRVLSVPLQQGAGCRSESLCKNVATLGGRNIRLPVPACSTSRLSKSLSFSQYIFWPPPKLFTVGCGGEIPRFSSPPVNNFGSTIRRRDANNEERVQ